MRHAARTAAKPKLAPLYAVRRSRIHGSGVYATRRIRKGTRIVEYLGDRISHAQADARYEAKGQDDGHTFLFVVDGRTVIDAGVNGNDARFINHSCDPNCETVIEDRRVFIEALRTIQPGEELGYEYGLTWRAPTTRRNSRTTLAAAGLLPARTMLDAVPLDKKKAARKRR